MDAATYQREAARTLIDDSAVVALLPRDHRLVWNAVGLAGEVGEVVAVGPRGLSMADLQRAALRLCELVKKGIFHERGLDLAAFDARLSEVVDACDRLSGFQQWPYLGKELGDVLWYTAALCSVLGWDFARLFRMPPSPRLQTIMAENIAKLQIRFPRGWDLADERARVDVAAEGVQADTVLAQGGQA